jgi:MFS family permease
MNIKNPGRGPSHPTSNSTEKLYPWAIICLSSAFLFYKYITQVSPSIMTTELMQTFNIQGTGLGNLAATFFYSYLITQLFVGVLLDRYSPRYLSALAIAISAGGTFMFAHSDTLIAACAARALMGVGAAFATVNYMKLTANWFKPDQFAFISGLLATAAMVGAIFGQAPLAWLVSHQGWRQSLDICAIVGVVIAVLFVIVVRDSPGYAISAVAKKGKYAVTFRDVWSVLSRKDNWLLTFYSGLSFAPLAVFGGLWGNPYLKEAYHFSNTQVAFLMSLVFFGLAIGGPLLGYISDRLRARRVVMRLGSALSLVAITTAIYWVNLPAWLLASLLFLFGLGTGTFMLGFAIGKEINKAVLSATVVALINTGDAIFGAFTEPMIGKFLDLSWHKTIVNGVHQFSIQAYHWAFLVIPIYLVIALVLVFFIKEGNEYSC